VDSFQDFKVDYKDIKTDDVPDMFDQKDFELSRIHNLTVQAYYKTICISTEILIRNGRLIDMHTSVRPRC